MNLDMTSWQNIQFLTRKPIFRSKTNDFRANRENIGKTLTTQIHDVFMSRSKSPSTVDFQLQTSESDSRETWCVESEARQINTGSWRPEAKNGRNHLSCVFWIRPKSFVWFSLVSLMLTIKSEYSLYNVSVAKFVCVFWPSVGTMESFLNSN